MRDKVLITGGAGFLGVHLARKLLKSGYNVTLFDIAPLDAKDLIGKVVFVKGDVRNRKQVFDVSKDQNYIIHAAAALPIVQNKKEIFSINVLGTKNILAASLRNRVNRLVFISTTAVYGVPKSLPEKEDSLLSPIGYYGESKLAAENLCKDFTKKGLSINIVRPKTFLGPERLGVFQLWFEATYTNKHVFILGNGNNRYQLLAVSDVVDAVEKAMTAKIDGEIFNLGAKDFGTWKSDLGGLIKQAKSKSKIIGLPVLPSQMILYILEIFKLSPIAAWHYKTLPVNSYVSIKKAERLLNWQPKKSNKELLIESYNWYKKHRNEIISKIGTTHRVGWNFKILNLISKIFN